MGVPISCRVSDPYSHVTLTSVPSREEIHTFYDNKMGFFGSLSPGRYQCETTVNGAAITSDVYTVYTGAGKSRRRVKHGKGTFQRFTSIYST